MLDLSTICNFWHAQRHQCSLHTLGLGHYLYSRDISCGEYFLTNEVVEDVIWQHVVHQHITASLNCTFVFLAHHIVSWGNKIIAHQSLKQEEKNKVHKHMIYKNK